jgi:hypothetical protein
MRPAVRQRKTQSEQSTAMNRRQECNRCNRTICFRSASSVEIFRSWQSLFPPSTAWLRERRIEAAIRQCTHPRAAHGGHPVGCRLLRFSNDRVQSDGLPVPRASARNAIRSAPKSRQRCGRSQQVRMSLDGTLLKERGVACAAGRGEAARGADNFDRPGVAICRSGRSAVARLPAQSRP